MVTPIGLAGSSHPQPRSTQSPPPPTPQAINDMTKKLKNRVNQLSGELSKKTGLTPPSRTPEQETAFQNSLKSAAISILKKQNSITKPVSDALFTDENGLSHREVPNNLSVDKQKRFFESVAQNVFEQKVKPMFDREAQRQQEAYQNTYRYKLSQKAQSLYSSALNGIAKLASFVAPLPKESSTGEGSTQDANSGPSATPQGQAKPTPQNKETQDNEDTDKIAKELTQSIFANVLKKQQETTEGQPNENTGSEAASGKQAVAGAADPKAADGDTKADTKKPETEKKETSATPKQEEGGIMKGWIKTKVGLGAALLAGGIALKMTLIGIIPGLIMAGAGAALMGWGSLNYFMKDK